MNALLGTGCRPSAMAIIAEWQDASGERTDNAVKFFWLTVFKAVMDTLLMCQCLPEWRTSFLGLCSASVLLVNWAAAGLMGCACFLGASGPFAASPCAVLAGTSATYAALPLPMLCLGILDFLLEDTCLGSRRPTCKLLRNHALLVVAWVHATYTGARSANAELTELKATTGQRFLVCSMQEVPLVTNSILLLFGAVLLALLPFYSSLGRWATEASRIAEERERQDLRTSDFFDSKLSKESCGEEGEEEGPQGPGQPRPPMWLSLTLAFADFWMPYLAMAAAIAVCGVRTPAFAGVNLFWLECAKSVLEGLSFWAASWTTGPYGGPPDSACSWRAYWHLSRGTQTQMLPKGVCKPSTEKKNTILFV